MTSSSPKNEKGNHKVSQFILGTIAGAFLTTLAGGAAGDFWRRLTAPPAALVVEFSAKTDNDTLRVAPSVESPTSARTRPFLVGLKVRNNGSLDAKGPRLKITADKKIEVWARTLGMKHRALTKGAVSTELALPDVRPHETLDLDDELCMTFPNFVFRDQEVVESTIPDIHVGLMMEIRGWIDVEMSWEGSPPKTRRLWMILGPRELLAEQRKPFLIYQYPDSATIEVTEVKDYGLPANSPFTSIDGK